MDFVQTLRPRTSDRALVWSGRITTLAFMVIAALWAPQIQRFPTLWQYLQSVLAYVTPPIVVVFLMGIFWPRASRTGAAATIVIGLLLGAGGWILVEVYGLADLQFLYACGILFLLNCAVMVIVSLASAPPAPEVVERYTWRPALWREESKELADRPWYANYRTLSWILTAATLALVLWWL